MVLCSYYQQWLAIWFSTFQFISSSTTKWSVWMNHLLTCCQDGEWLPPSSTAFTSTFASYSPSTWTLSSNFDGDTKRCCHLSQTLPTDPSSTAMSNWKTKSTRVKEERLTPHPMPRRKQSTISHDGWQRLTPSKYYWSRLLQIEVGGGSIEALPSTAHTHCGLQRLHQSSVN